MSKHLVELKKYDVTEGSLDPGTPMPWLSNVVVTEKKISGQICIKIDMRRANTATLESHIPFPTVHALQHKLN